MDEPRPGPSRHCRGVGRRSGNGNCNGNGRGQVKRKCNDKGKGQGKRKGGKAQPQPGPGAKKIKLKDLRIVLKDCAPSPDPKNFFVLEQVFENELILDVIAEYLKDSMDDLKRGRRVNSKWKRVATKRIQKENWKNRAFLYLTSEKEFKKYIKTVSAAAPDDVLFSCYVIQLASKYRLYNEKLMLSLFETLSQKMKSLSLGFDFKSCKQIEDILKTQSNSLTELQVLTAATELARPSDKSFEPGTGNADFQLTNLNLLCFSLQEDEVDLEGMYSRLVNPIPYIPVITNEDKYKVIKVVLSKIPPEKDVKICLMQWQRLRATIPTFQMFNQIKNLKVVDLSRNENNNNSGELKRGELQALADAGVKLQNFLMEPAPDFEGGDDDDELQCTKEVYAFLGTQAANLEMLSWGSNFNFKFPSRMPKLKKLRLNCEKYVEDSDDDDSDDEDELDLDGYGDVRRRKKEWVQSCGPILYDQIFPKLEQLELLSDFVDSLTPVQFIAWFMPPQMPCNTLKKLAIEYPGMNVQIMRTISSTFPNIKYLAFSYSKEFLTRDEERDLYSALFTSEFAPTLEDLCIEYQGDTDDYAFWDSHPSRQNRRKLEMDILFSGLLEGKIRQLTRIPDYELKDFTSELIGGRGSIVDLTSLKKLVIHGSDDLKWKNGHLTDFSVFCLFGRMTHLEFLHVDEKIRNFSAGALEYLRSKSKSQQTLTLLSGDTHLEDIFQCGFHTATATASDQDNPIKPLNLLNVNANVEVSDANSGVQNEEDESENDDDEENEREWRRRRFFGTPDFSSSDSSSDSDSDW